MTRFFERCTVVALIRWAEFFDKANHRQYDASTREFVAVKIFTSKPEHPMPELTQADIIWNRACGEDPLRSVPGDRALADLLRAHGLVMNGGVLHAAACLTASELSDAESGFSFYGLDASAILLSRAKTLLQANDDLEFHERQLDQQ